MRPISEMCIDAIESTYREPNIGCYVFVSADSDVIPILSRMMYKGKKVELLYLSAAAPKNVDITSYAHDSVDLFEFLNIEEIKYDLTQYTVPSLQLIQGWNMKNVNNKDRWLGGSLLKSMLQKSLSIPGDTASRLLEHLEIERLIKLEKRDTTQGPKQSYIVLAESKEFDVLDEAASTNESS